LLSRRPQFFVLLVYLSLTEKYSDFRKAFQWWHIMVFSQ
jgi:hypothetical protein